MATNDKPPRREPGLVMLTSRFPAGNETFIVREVQDLIRRGIDVTMVSLRQRPPTIHDADAQVLAASTLYPPTPLQALRRATRLFVRNPRAATRGLARAIGDVAAQWRHPAAATKQLVMVPFALALAGDERIAGRRVHAHFASVPTGVARILAAVWGRGYSFTAHAFDLYMPEHASQLGRRIAGADFVVTCTYFNRETLVRQIRRRADADKVHALYHGLELHRYRPGAERDPGLIVGGASLEAKKGIGDLIEVVARLCMDGRNVRCVIVGEGPERGRLERLVADRRLESQVRFVGRIPHAEVIEWLRRAEVVAHPSVVDRRGSMDGVPNFVLEALAVETPVVASALSAIPEAVIDGRTGYLHEPGDRDGLAAAIVRILDDPRAAHEMGERGRTLIRERFDLARNGERLARLHRAFLGEVAS